MTDITVTRNDEESRYELRSDDVLAGFAAFDLRPGSIRFTHTEIDPAFQGQDWRESSHRPLWRMRRSVVMRSCRCARTSRSTRRPTRCRARRSAGRSPSAPAGSAGEDPTGRAE